MTTWKDGRAELYRRLVASLIPIEMFLKDVASHNVHRVSGTAVFMASSSQFTPPSLLHHFKHNQVLHERVLLLTIQVTDFPSVPDAERVSFEELGEGFHRVLAYYGFMETPNVPQIMQKAFAAGIIPSLHPISYYLGRETLITSGKSKVLRWRKGLFAFLSRNSRSASRLLRYSPQSCRRTWRSNRNLAFGKKITCHLFGFVIRTQTSLKDRCEYV